MRVCFVVSEIFAFGIYGGFGKLTRDLAEGLIDRGVEVLILVRSLSKEQKSIEFLDGKLPVIKLPRVISRMTSVLFPNKAKVLFKLPEADIYHSEPESIDSWLAMKHNPNKKHIITFQDPRTFEDYWKVEKLDLPPPFLNETDFNFRRRIFGYFEQKAVNGADKLYCQAKYIIPKVMSMYAIPQEKIPRFLPNPVKLPIKNMEKAPEPTVCFLGRWDAQKRPEIFLNLSRNFPEIKFIMVGNKETAYAKNNRLYERFKNQPNLIIKGFVSEKEKYEILEKSWFLINTSIRECLPISFIESLGHETPIISAEDPDNIVSAYGTCVGYNFGDYVEGLKTSLKTDWFVTGKRGRDYVHKNFEFNNVIDQHMEVYKEILS